MAGREAEILKRCLGPILPVESKSLKWQHSLEMEDQGEEARFNRGQPRPGPSGLWGQGDRSPTRQSRRAAECLGLDPLTPIYPDI